MIPATSMMMYCHVTVALMLTLYLRVKIRCIYSLLILYRVNRYSSLILQPEVARIHNAFGFSTSLNVAAKAGGADIVDRLPRANADFTSKGAYNIDDSALEVAAEGGHFDVVQRLLKAEKDVTSVDGYYSLAALHAAVQDGQHNEVERL